MRWPIGQRLRQQVERPYCSGSSRPASTRMSGPAPSGQRHPLAHVQVLGHPHLLRCVVLTRVSTNTGMSARPPGRRRQVLAEQWAVVGFGIRSYQVGPNFRIRSMTLRWITMHAEPVPRVAAPVSRVVPAHRIAALALDLDQVVRCRGGLGTPAAHPVRLDLLLAESNAPTIGRSTGSAAASSDSSVSGGKPMSVSSQNSHASADSGAGSRRRPDCGRRSGRRCRSAGRGCSRTWGRAPMRPDRRRRSVAPCCGATSDDDLIAAHVGQADLAGRLGHSHTHGCPLSLATRSARRRPRTVRTNPNAPPSGVRSSTRNTS